MALKIIEPIITKSMFRYAKKKTTAPGSDIDKMLREAQERLDRIDALLGKRKQKTVATPVGEKDETETPKKRKLPKIWRERPRYEIFEKKKAQREIERIG